MGIENGNFNFSQEKIPRKREIIKMEDDNGSESERIKEDITFDEFISFVKEDYKSEMSKYNSVYSGEGHEDFQIKTSFYASEEDLHKDTTLTDGIFEEIVDLSQLKSFKFKKYTDPERNKGCPNSSPQHDSEDLDIPSCYTQFSYVILFDNDKEVGILYKDVNMDYKGGYDGYIDNSQIAQWYVSSKETQMKWSDEKKAWQLINKAEEDPLYTGKV